MSMSTHVIAFRDMDGEFARILEAKKFCDNHKLSYPKEVEEYFQGLAGESEELIRSELLEVPLGDVLTKWTDGFASEGYEVDVTRLPKEVKTLRFYNSW